MMMSRCLQLLTAFLLLFSLAACPGATTPSGIGPEGLGQVDEGLAEEGVNGAAQAGPPEQPTETAFPGPTHDAEMLCERLKSDPEDARLAKDYILDEEDDERIEGEILNAEEVEYLYDKYECWKYEVRELAKEESPQPMEQIAESDEEVSIPEGDVRVLESDDRRQIRETVNPFKQEPEVEVPDGPIEAPSQEQIINLLR